MTLLTIKYDQEECVKHVKIADLSAWAAKPLTCRLSAGPHSRSPNKASPSTVLIEKQAGPAVFTLQSQTTDDHLCSGVPRSLARTVASEYIPS